MRIGILQTGRAPDELIARHGDYNEMFMTLLAGRGMTFTTYRVLDDEFPDSASSADGWLITGSRCGVYDGFPWIARLEDWLRQAIAQHAPVIGICFGHQVIAQALGGTVRKFDGGWQVGLKTYRNPMTGEQSQLLAWHQDQVISAPEHAVLRATALECRFAGLQLGDSVRTWQAHPEFSPDYIMGLFDVRGETINDDILRVGRDSLTEGVPDDVSGEMTEFLIAAAARRESAA